MNKLLWKDYRLTRPLLILCAAVWGMLYLVGVGTQLAMAWPRLPTLDDWAGMLISCGTVGMYLTICFAGLFGGHAIACERSDRSANFLACLPPTKGQILTSKLVVAVGTLAAMVGWVLFSLYVIAARLSSEPIVLGEMATVPGLATVSVLTFGVGWMASAMLEKTTVPIVLALLSPVAVGGALILVGSALGIPMVRVSEWSNPVSFIVGTATFAAGTWHYCRRVEP